MWCIVDIYVGGTFLFLGLWEFWEGGKEEIWDARGEKGLHCLSCGWAFSNWFQRLFRISYSQSHGHHFFVCLWLDFQRFRFFFTLSIYTHLFCFLRALTMSLCFPKAFLHSLAWTRTAAFKTLTLYPHYLSVFPSSKSQQYVVWNG